MGWVHLHRKHLEEELKKFEELKENNPSEEVKEYRQTKIDELKKIIDKKD